MLRPDGTPFKQTVDDVGVMLGVALSDDRFRFATREVAKPLLPAVEAPDRYWWSRVPRMLDGELLEDLKADGVV